MTIRQAEISGFFIHNINAQLCAVRDKWDTYSKETQAMLKPYYEEMSDAIDILRKVDFAIERTIIPTLEAIERRKDQVRNNSRIVIHTKDDFQRA